MDVVDRKMKNLGVECDGGVGGSEVGLGLVEMIGVEGESLLEKTPTRKVVKVVTHAEVNEMDVSPEISKAVSAKRFKFSPGMVIGVILSVGVVYIAFTMV